MNRSDYDPLVHRVALLAACTALLPIVIGSLVTTKGFGMAFADWPSSDGYSMLLYPWLRSAGDKFLEHGHRLAGMLIGLVSIGLVAVVLLRESRTWVKWLAAAVLASVVIQGLLGGQRVLLADRGLAFVHGAFASLVLTLMATMAMVTSRGWRSATPAAGSTADSAATGSLARLKVLGIVTSLALFGQYILGGLVRHLGMMLHQHLGFAIIAAALVVFLFVSMWLEGNRWLRAPAVAAQGLILAQLLLGAGAWVTKYGFGDFVAVYDSPGQVLFRTAHQVTGMLLFMTVVLGTIRVLRLNWIAGRARGIASSNAPVPQSLTLSGGVS
jgi:cytochrome c oxidase assembly protein subunit 15